MTAPLPPSAVARAEARANDARERLTRTLGALQARLDPRTVAREAVGGLAESGGQALRTGVETAKRHPGAVAGAAAVIAALLTRRRIASLFRRKPQPLPEPAQPARDRRVRMRPRPAPAKRND